MLYVRNVHLTKGQAYSIFSSERAIHKDYYRKSSAEKVSGHGSQGAWRQDELISGKPPVVK
jgi:hypothetical protein